MTLLENEHRIIIIIIIIIELQMNFPFFGFLTEDGDRTGSPNVVLLERYVSLKQWMM